MGKERAVGGEKKNKNSDETASFQFQRKKKPFELIVRFLSSHYNLLSSSFSFSEEEEEQYSERTARVLRRRESSFALLLRRRSLFVREARRVVVSLYPSFYSHLQFFLPLASDFKFEIRLFTFLLKVI